MRRRRSYKMHLVVNGRSIEEVVIDPHYEIKHPDIDDELILKLVRRLDGKEFQSQARHNEWEFYVLDRIEYRGRQYRLVWCHQDASPLLAVNQGREHSSSPRPLKKVQMQGGARCEVRGVLSPYVAVPRERANAADGRFSAA